MPPERGVRISSAPKAFMVCARSTRQVLRHDQHHAVAADRRGHRQRDAGVARGRLDQRVAGLDLAALLGAPDHADRRPVLHRAGRVVAFELAEDDVAALLVVGARHAHQAHQRRVADDVFDGVVAGAGTGRRQNPRRRGRRKSAAEKGNLGDGVLGALKRGEKKRSRFSEDFRGGGEIEGEAVRVPGHGEGKEGGRGRRAGRGCAARVVYFPRREAPSTLVQSASSTRRSACSFFSACCRSTRPCAS